MVLTCYALLLLLPCCRDHAISAYTAAGLEVAVLGDSPLLPGVDAAAADAALMSCLMANERLLHRAVLKRPLSVLKYAMTLDGKIATGEGVREMVMVVAVGWVLGAGGRLKGGSRVQSWYLRPVPPVTRRGGGGHSTAKTMSFSPPPPSSHLNIT